jgi:hypothetical protein
MVLLFGLSSQAHADARTKWKITLGASIAVSLGGGLLSWRSFGEVQDLHDDQCNHGLSQQGETGCQLQPGVQPWTEAQVVESNRRGDQLAMRANIGYLVAAVGLVGVGVSGIKLLTFEDDKPDRAVVVAPTVTSHGAGAALTLHW